MWGINTSLLPAKLHYFAFFASHAGILPFCVTIAAQFGASPALVGIIFLTLPLFAVLAKPGFGFLADKLQGKKSIFLCCVLLMTAAFSSICFIPPVAVTARAHDLACLSDGWYLESCNWPQSDNTISCHATCDPSLPLLCVLGPSSCPSPNDTYMHFQAKVQPASEAGCSRLAVRLFGESVMPICNNTISRCNVTCSSSHHAQPGTYHVTPQIIYFWVLMIIAYVFMGTATSLGDTLVLGMIPSYEAFGRQRLYGGIGFGVLSIVAGQLVDMFSQPASGSGLNFMPAYCVVLVFGAMDFGIALFFTEKKADKPKHLFKNVGRLFLNAETMLLTAAVFFVGFFSGVLWTYLIVYLVGLGANQLLIGLTIGMQCFLGEIPFMFVSAWFLKKIGHGHSMSLVLAVFGVRFLLYHLVDDPWLVLPVETTQGICFGIFFTALATYGSIIAPPSSHATMQGILQAVFEGLGAGLGAFIGGLVYEASSGKTMWLVMGVASCICAGLHALVLFIIQRRKKKQSSEQQKDLTNGGANEPKAEELLRMMPVHSSKIPDRTGATVDIPKE